MNRLVLVMTLLLGGCLTSGTVDRAEWSVMDTVAAVQCKGGYGKAAEGRSVVRDVFARVEALLNAHDPDSELNALAGHDDDEILACCDPLVRPCYEAAFRLRDETDGLFNPRWRGPDTLDLGAIAKGYAVDLAVAALSNRTEGADVLVDLGGNLRAVSGTWKTEIARPSAARRTAGETFLLSAGMACATSGEYYRGHHIKDGRTGAAVVGKVLSVTVIHPTSAMLADGLSTTLFLLGKEKGNHFLKTRYPEATACWYTK